MDLVDFKLNIKIDSENWECERSFVKKIEDFSQQDLEKFLGFVTLYFDKEDVKRKQD